MQVRKPKDGTENLSLKFSLLDSGQWLFNLR